MKIYYPTRDQTPGPAEPETDMLPSEPARRVHTEMLNKQKGLNIILKIVG